MTNLIMTKVKIQPEGETPERGCTPKTTNQLHQREVKWLKVRDIKQIFKKRTVKYSSKRPEASWQYEKGIPRVMKGVEKSAAMQDLEMTYEKGKYFFKTME